MRWIPVPLLVTTLLAGCGGGVTAASIPLAIEFLVPSAEARVPLGASIPVSINVASPSDAASVEIVASRDGLESPVASIRDADGQQDVTWDTAGLPHGAYRLIARAIDGDEAAEADAPGTIVLDAPPEVLVLEPSTDDAPEGTATIRYIDDDPDSPASTTLLADRDGDLATSADRLLVRGALPHGSGAGRSVTWDLAGVPPGAYTIVAVIDDGVNPQVTSASSGRIHVLGELALTAAGVSGYAAPEAFYDDQTMGIASYRDGSFVVAGNFSGEAVWGEGQANETRVVAAGDRDIFVARYDAAGALLWVRTAGGGEPDRAIAVAAFPDGSCVVAGGVRGGAVFGPGETAPGKHAFYVRYDASGNLLWMHSASTHVGRATCLAPLDDNGFLVGGWFYRRIILDWDQSTSVRLESASDGYPDGFLARCDADGRVVWARIVDADAAAELRGIAVFPDGSCVATGAFERGASVSGGEPDAVTLTSPWSEPPLLVDRCFIARWDADGRLLWARTPGGTSSHAGSGVIARPDGTAVVTGYFDNSGSIAIPAPDNHILFDGIRLDATLSQDQGFAACYGPAGAVVWAGYAGPDDRLGFINHASGRPSSIVPLADGGFAVVGWFWATRKFGTTTVKSEGGWDLYIARYGSDGALTGFETAGGPGDDQAWALAAAPQGWLMLVGRFQETMAIGSGTIDAPAEGSHLLVARVREN